jgi:hypothetical protein
MSQDSPAPEPPLVDPGEASDRVANSRPRPINLAIDSKLRGCDVVTVRVDDVDPNGYTLDRATVRQKTTRRPVRTDGSGRASHR